MTPGITRSTLAILLVNSALGLLCISGCGQQKTITDPAKNNDYINKMVEDQKQSALQESGEKLQGESVAEFIYANKKTFIQGDSFAITSLERRDNEDGEMTIIARCEGTKEQKVMLIISYTYRDRKQAVDRKQATVNIVFSDDYESRSGKFSVASRPIDVSEFSGTGDIHAFLMPYDNFPKWSFGEEKQDINSISNIFRASVTFGDSDDPAPCE